MVYLDHNASTPLDPRVRAEMSALLADPAAQANPSSLHRLGQGARSRLEQARRRVAHAIGCEPLEVTFTSGGTEADSLAVLGVARALRRAGRASGVLTSPLEHPAVLDAATRLRADGHPCVWVAPDAQGRISPADVAACVREHPELGLVSLAAVNHELGNVYDVPALVGTLRALRPELIIHTDAVQAFGKVPVDFCAWGVDLLSISAHKIGGPTGVGALVHRKQLAIESLLVGGHQERGRRPGTENLLGVHGFGIAAELAATEQGTRSSHRGRLHGRLSAGLAGIDGCRILGDPDAHCGGTVLAAFDGCDGELLMINLDLAGIAVSTGSACTAGSREPSHVVLGLGLGPEVARSTLRICVGHGNSDADIDVLLAELPSAVARVRAAATAGPGERPRGPE